MNPEEQGPSGMATNQELGGASAEKADAPARPGPADVQAYIGRQLRAVYDDVVKQPIPDRFLALMKQLEEGPPKG